MVTMAEVLLGLQKNLDISLLCTYRKEVQRALESIRSEGAEASITDFNYDDTVRYAEEMANKHGWVLVQDTAWDGYTEIPSG